MSKKDTSLERIDIMKLLIFVLAFVVVCFGMVFAFILPGIKDYRVLSAQNRSQTAAYLKVKQTHDAKLEALENTKQKYKDMIIAYEAKFNRQNFVNFVSTYLNDVKISDMDEPANKEKFYKYGLSVEASTKDPQKFYDFLDALEKYESIVKTDFPVIMSSDGERINIKFNVIIYGANPQN